MPSKGQAGNAAPNGASDTLPAGRRDKDKQRRAEPQDASRLLQARISQLEQDAGIEKSERAALDRDVRSAQREMEVASASYEGEAKVDFLMRKSNDLIADMRRLEREYQKYKKKIDTLTKEKETLRSDLAKSTGLKEKLEKLCRELQKDNNKLKNENKTLQDNWKRGQNAWDEKFATVLSKLEGYQAESDKPRRQGVSIAVEDLFRERFKSFVDQYELRELHFHSLMRTKELEVQYNMARCERERKRAHGEEARAQDLEFQVQTFAKTETELRGQLNVYANKFKTVEDTLNNSNDLFLTFRKEMEDMSKKTKKLEKENESFKRKHDATNANILRMAEEREDWKRRADAAEKKAAKLTSVIRDMQQQGRKPPPKALPPKSAPPRAPPPTEVSSDEPREGEEPDAGNDSEASEDGLDNVNGSEGFQGELDSSEGSDRFGDISDFNEDSEEDASTPLNPRPVVYGPEPPPKPAKPAVNGH